MNEQERAERRREAGRKGGLARAKTLTREHQRAARRKVSSESCSRNGKRGAKATMERYGYETLFRKCRRHRLLNPSQGELLMIGILHRLGIESEREWRVGASFYTVDFYLPNLRKVIEVDGRIHQVFEREERAERDRRKAELLDRAGVELLRISHKEMADVESVIAKVKAFANGGAR